MHSTPFRIETEVTLFTDDQGDIIGHMVAVPRSFDQAGYRADRVDYAGYVHNWESEGAYVPVSLGVVEDPELLKDEIEQRAREAQAPTSAPVRPLVTLVRRRRR